MTETFGFRLTATDARLGEIHTPRGMTRTPAFMRQAYAHAIRSGYRFYSYGDACLLWPG